MASPSESEIIALFQAIVHLEEETREFAEDDAVNALLLIDTIEQSLETDFAGQITTALDSYRGDVSASLTRSSALLTPLLRTWAKFIDVPERDAQGMLDRLYDHFIDTGQRIASRIFVFGAAVAGGSNAGDGVLNRLAENEDGLCIENAHSETKTVVCTSDQTSGADKHEEIFEIRGGAAGKDALEVSGSGRTTEIKALSARDSILGNPSFSRFSGTIAALTALTDWTPTTALSNFTLDETNFYRDFVGDTTPRSVIFGANDTLSQAMSVRRRSLSPGVPYFFQVAYNREIAGADGTLTISLGTQSVSVALAAQTGWNILVLPVDKNLFYKNFNEQDLDVSIQVSGGATFGLRVDDVILAPMTQVDGTWWALVGGATPFLRDDEFASTDSESSTYGVIQRWLWRSFGRYLPQALPAPSSAPIAAVGGAGNVDAGLHSYVVNFASGNVLFDDVVSGPSPVSATVNPGVNSQINLSSIPLGPTGTTARNIFRTVSGDTGNHKFVGKITDNTTTVFVDNVADSSLGADAPTGITIQDP